MKATKKIHIPQFESYEEEAQWWDTHDVTDYLDEFEEPKLVSANTHHVTSVYLDDSAQYVVMPLRKHQRRAQEAVDEIYEEQNEQ